METKKFDLNIEKILEDWEVYDAIREIIANALDEQLLTNKKDIEIFKDLKRNWHIRDYGRGLKYDHLTQKEDEEKLKNPFVIGKFGIGLKDALATFDRKGINFLIKSKYGDISLGKSQKHDFEDIITLHANIQAASDTNFIGTEFILNNVKDEDVYKAKNIFLKFSGEKIIESTKFGDVLVKIYQTGRIYINGVKVAEEENFLFSYNITSLTDKIKKELNRERTNVGRNAYSDRVKSILLNCKSEEVAKLLVESLKEYSSGKMKDELNWIDVQEHAVKILNATEKVVFLTSEELIKSTNMVDEAKSAGYRIITIPETLKEKIAGEVDMQGSTIRELGQFYKEYEESFNYKFIDPNKLNSNEKIIFSMTNNIFSLIGGRPSIIREIKISETLQKEWGGFEEAVGLWESAYGRIIIKRTLLCSIDKYASSLLHETAHALSGASDVSRSFEKELTRLIGEVIKRIRFSN